MKPIIGDLVVAPIDIKVPERFKKLMPSTLKSQKCKLTLSNCNNAVANGIRRTIACELSVKHLTCEYESITTDDPFIIQEMIQKRLRMIPLLQSIPAGARFELNITNMTPGVIDVKTGDIIASGGGEGRGGEGRGSNANSNNSSKYFDATYTLLSLNVGRKISIKDIKVATNYGYIEGYGMCTVAVHATSICKDMIPYNMYTGEGVHTHTADPKVWEIKFETNGTMHPKDIIVAACNNIIDRMRSVTTLLHTIVNNKDEYILQIHGESDTIGNLLMKTIVDIYPDAEHVSYNVPTAERISTIKVKYDDDINSLYKNAIDHIIATYEHIRDEL